MIYLVRNELFEHEQFKPSSVEACIRFLNNYDELGLDLETHGFDPYTCGIISIQLSAGGREYVIDCEQVDILKFKKLLETKLLIGHNLKFDLRFLYNKDIWPTKVFDTFLAECVLFTGIQEARKSLDHCLQKYLNVQLDKSIRANISKEGLSTRVIGYAAKDVEHIHDLKAKQIIELKKLDLERCMSLENEFVLPLAYIEYCGIKLDSIKWKARTDKVRKLHQETELMLNELVVRDYSDTKFVSRQLDLFSDGLKCSILWTSPKQVTAFFKHLGVEIKVKDKKTKREKDTVDIKQLAKYKDKFPIIGLYIQFKEFEKELSTYGDNWFDYINPASQRVHTSYRQMLDTGRISSGSRNRITGESYPNLQNLPADPEVRECFVPEEGNKLCIADYASQEINVFVNKSLEPKMLEFFNKGYSDMHSFIAQKIYPELAGLDFDEIKKKHNSKRQTSKVGNFAILYGAVPITLSTQLGIEISEAEFFYDQYFKEFTAIREYFKQAYKQSSSDGYILIDEITGRKSFISNFEEFRDNEHTIKSNSSFWDDYRSHKASNSKEFIEFYQPLVRRYFSKKGEIERSSVNYRIQGTSASITKLSCVYLYRWILENKLNMTVKIVNTIHDENIVECPEHMANEVSKKLKECMERAGDVFCKTIKLKAEPCISTHWNK